MKKRNTIFKNKKAIQVSVNFIVVLILAMATFSLAVGLTYNIFSKAYKLKTDIDAQTKHQIGTLLDSGEKVALPVNRLQIKRGKNDAFGLGILNTEDSAADFRVLIGGVNNKGVTRPNSIAIFDKDGKRITKSSVKSSAKGIKINFIRDVKGLEPNKQQIVLIQAVVGKDVEPGYVYSYTIKVQKEGTDYGFPQKMYIEV